MKITVCGPVESISGTYPDSDLIYYTVKRTGKIYGRGKAKPFDPKSENQRASRSINTKASRVWTSLTAAARADWEKFTK